MRHTFLSLLFTAAIALAFAAAPASAQLAPKAGGVKASVPSTDKKFVKDAAEAQLGILHLTELSTRPDSPGSDTLKTLNKSYAADINTAWGELGTLAQAKGAELPDTKVSGNEKRTIETVKKAKPAEYDKLFLKTLTKEAKKMGTVVEAGSKSAQDPEIKAWAEKWAPKFKTHYEEIDKAENEESKKK